MNDLFVCCYDEFTCIIFCDRSLKMQKLPNFIATDDQHKVQTRSSSRDRTFGGPITELEWEKKMKKKEKEKEKKSSACKFCIL